MTVHLFFFPCRRRSAARVACSNTSLTPSFILAEHSRYLTAPILRATASPCVRVSITKRIKTPQGHSPDARVGCGGEKWNVKGEFTSSGETGLCWVLRSSSIVFGSYRKSFLHPTKIIGSPWQKCKTSLIHYDEVSAPCIHTNKWDLRKVGIGCVCVWQREGERDGIGRWREGGNHTFSWTLSNESGESIAKQIKMTWESG